MEASGDELSGIQSELQAVKRALRDGAVHLGMKGETLQRYLLQLNEKENLLLSRQLRHMSSEPYEPPPQLPPPWMGVPGPALAVPAPVSNGHGNAVASLGSAESGAVPAGRAKEEVPRPVAKDPPPGPARALHKEDLGAVLVHMCDYEAIPTECHRALRALASLAYADAQGVGANDAVVNQLLRLLAIHPTEPQVHLAAMRALCNMAYDQAVAMERLANTRVMAALLANVTASVEPKDTAAKASEAIARIAAAEMHPEVGEAKVPPSVSVDGSAALGGLFAAASCGEATWRDGMPRIVAQLIANEVVEPAPLAKCFVHAGLQCSAQASSGWLSMAKCLASSADCPDPELPQALIDAGSIRTAADLMERYLAEAATQLAGVEAMSSLVGNRWAGLQAFAEVGGMQRIEAAMRTHGSEAVLQMKGVRALASGVQWPEDVQVKAQYSWRSAVELTKAAMTQHGDSPDLQAAALEGLAKYLDKLRCVDEVSQSGGDGLVKAMMAKHGNEEKVQHWGKVVLGSLGVDRKWAPRGAQG